MKKISAIVFGVLCLSTAAFSQTTGTTQFGIQVGYNGATVTSGEANAAFKAGFNAGVAVEHYFSEHWSFKGKVLYDQKGWVDGFYTINGNTFATTFTTYHYNLNYVTIPLLANWHFGRTKNWYLNFGPYIGFLTSAELKDSNTDIKGYFNSTDGGLDVGIGVKFPIGAQTRFFIEYNAEAGVVNINNGPSTSRNTTGAFNIGLTF
ncbi:porin family protein [Mucilaginibacter boryungensis]|uniref:PorT family protein n=1 Tax=Mucilaginibacter boryungensis TaxID=768480 RepID=A0ABR9XHI4_9SPHI|nr:porin family protein [Mucilaginibacter boryungensis]MBE9666463.1 PorT family protein [Mucilaginibacter boryungensis]